MADDKENASPDPWANIESGDAAEGDNAFSFSLDGLEADAPAADLNLGDTFSFSADEPAADAGEEPVFSLEAEALAEDLPIHEEPAIEEAAAPTEPFAAAFGEDEPTDIVADAVAEDLAGDADPFSFVAADREPEADAGGADVSLVGGASSIDIGTGESGITPESDIIPTSDASEDGFEGLNFGVPQDVEAAAGDDEGGFGIESFAEEEPAAAWPGAAGEEQAGDEQPEDAFGFAEAESSDAVETLAMGAAAAGAVAAVAPKKAARPAKTSKPAKQGGLGQMIGVVVGGLMALPITYAILIWGFQKDPFKLTKSLPEQVAFLLPAKFQPGARAAGAPKLTGGPSLDDLAKLPAPEMPVEPKDDENAAEAAAPEEPSLDAPAPREESGDGAATEPDDLKPDDLKPDDLKPDDLKPDGAKPAEVAVAPPSPAEPLDLSGVEAAVEAAEEGIATVAGIDPAATGGRKKPLVAWYKHLAKVGEELAMLETVAADTGRPLEDAPDAVKALYGKIASEEGAVDHLKRLCRDWVKFGRRPTDGVMLVASFDESRKVGPYWSSTVSLEEDDGSMKRVAVISRSEPKAQAGDRVVVTGMVFEDDVVWAADCRALEAGAAKAVDDLF